MAAGNTSAIPTYKVVLLGDAASGKTTLMRRLLTGQYQPLYVATLGVEVHPLRLRTRSGATGKVQDVCLDVWDTAGQERFGGLREGYYLQADAAVVACVASGTRKAALDGVRRWRTDFYRVCERAPVCVAYTKKDAVATKAWLADVATSAGAGSWCQVSARTHEGIGEPFAAVLRVLLGDASLQLVEGDPVAPPEVGVDAATLADYWEQLRLAQETPLADEEDA